MKASHGMLLLKLVAALVVSLAYVTPAWAELEFSGEEARAFSIQPRPYRLGHEFQLGAGVMPLDAFYVGLVIGASYTYHFTDFWAWEIAGAGYSLNIDTSLERDLRDKFGVAPVGGGGERIRLLASTSAIIKPLFGKLALFNRDIIFAETFFSLGLGPVLRGDFWLPAVNLGVGMRFWVSDVVAVRFDIRDYLIFQTYVPDNGLLFMLSVAFNINDFSLAGQDGVQ